MINSFNKYEVVVVKFPFASSLKYKARPAVIISSHFYNQNSRDTLLILAISSQIDQKLGMLSDTDCKRLDTLLNQICG